MKKLAENSDVFQRHQLLKWLSDEQMISDSQAKHVSALIDETGEHPDQIITKLGIATEQAVAELCSRITNLPLMKDADLPQNAIGGGTFNPHFLQRFRALPIKRDETSLQIAIVSPTDKQAIAGLRFAAQTDINLSVLTDSQFTEAFYALYETAADPQSFDDTAFDVTQDAGRLRDLASEEPVVRLVNRTITQAVTQRASDIHFEAAARDYRLKYRIDGDLRQRSTLPLGTAKAAVSRVKILAGLDIAEQRVPQDGRFTYSLQGRKIDIRVSTVPTNDGEGLVLRLLDPANLTLSLEDLGHSQACITQFQEFINRPSGIVLVTGPTGSGKTTTLYSWLRTLAGGSRKVLTIEDPVEYDLDGISQSQVNPAIDVTFATALRSFLRHDPDVIMVGEIRDQETAKMAAQAALTGHLVLSTLHTNDAPSAITRLADIGIDRYLISATLIGVVAQSLVRALCDHCKQPIATPPGLEPYLTGATMPAFHKAVGCEACDQTGYYGRMVIGECLQVDNKVQDLLETSQSTHQFAAACRNSGMITKYHDGVVKAAQGLTTIDEVNRVAVRND